MQTLKTKTLAWNHTQNPSAADIAWLVKHVRLHPLVAEELSRPTMRPRVDAYDEHLFLVLHVPLFDPKFRKTRPVEIDFIITKTALYTITYEAIPPLDDFFRICATDQSCEELYASKTTGHLVAAVLKTLYGFALRQLDHIQEHIEQIEERVFANEHDEEKVVEELSIVRHDIIDFRRSLKPQQSTLEALAEEGMEFFGHGARPFLDGALGEYQKVWHLAENHKEAIDALYENNVAVLQIKQNESMRVLAIMAFVTFPLMLFAALFSMDTIGTPIVGSRYDFWIIVGIMVAATIGMFVFFKRKRWL